LSDEKASEKYLGGKKKVNHVARYLKAGRGWKQGISAGSSNPAKQGEGGQHNGQIRGESSEKQQRKNLKKNKLIIEKG